MQRWKIGSVTVTKIPEVEIPGRATWLIPEATVENLLAEPWLQPHFCDADGRPRTSIHAFVIDTGALRVLVDTCVGNDKERPIPDWNKRQGPFLGDLAEAGYPADSIDRVLCTHLHVDHVGWNTRLSEGTWVPTFDRARYLFGRVEFEHWLRDDESFWGDVMGDSVHPVVDAGLVDLVEMDHKVCDEVSLEPTPGHTPGHVSVRIASQGETAVITGDLMHHPVQCAHPEWVCKPDVVPEQAAQTRRAFLERYADTPTLVLGTHFATPTAGRIVRDGDRWRFDA